MASSKRHSQSLNGSWGDLPPSPFITGSDADAAAWTEAWRAVHARDLIDSRIVSIDANTSVEDACDRLLSEDVPCLAVKDDSDSGYAGLFDYADVNAFLTLAATRHPFSLDTPDPDVRRTKIVEAAMAGSVTVQLVSNLSDKNPLVTLDYDSTIVSLLEVFSRGSHRVLVRGRDVDDPCLGMVSDRALLAWFASYAKSTPSFGRYLSNPLQALSLPSFNITASVIASLSSATILDAMKLMSEEGVSSVAVLDHESHALLSTVSVTDVGKIVVPSQSNQFLGTPLHQFISYVKQPDGSTDGVDKYPVYSVLPSSQLLYTIEKILATNAHRVFVARESTLSSPILGPSAIGNLCGIVSIVDILALFATLAGISNVDPTTMQRHRRQTSASSSSSSRSRSNSVNQTPVSIRRSPSVVTLGPPVLSPLDPTASPSLIPIVIPERRKSVRISKTGPISPSSAPNSAAAASP